MLAVHDRLAGNSLDFVALAPSAGPLAEALRQRGIVHVPLDLRDASGRRLPLEHAVAAIAERLTTLPLDVAHANSLSMGRLLGAAAPALPFPCLSHLRDILRLSAAAIADLNRNRTLIAVSHATSAFHIAQGGETERFRVLYNGVDCQRFRPRPPSGALRRELGLPEGAFLVLTVGQIGLRKGQDVLAVAAALAATTLPDTHYVLVGQRHSVKEENVAFERSISEEFARNGLAGRVHWLGSRSDVDRLMNECDLLVHPARQEPLGRVLLEAAASGLPIIASNVGGTPEILEDGRSARLVPAGDSATLAEAIVELRTSIPLRREFAEAARRTAEGCFSIDLAAAGLADIWNEIAAAP